MIRLKPYITEKSVKLAQNNQYTLLVPQTSSKNQIRFEVHRFFGVNPVDVRILREKTVSQFKLKRSSTERGKKKAIVVLPAGEKIPGFEIVQEGEKKEEEKAKEKKLKKKAAEND
jgi:large subunit ribosomal protein L23